MDAAVARAVRERSGERCEYCRDPESVSLAAFHVDHIIARQHGGGDELENLALACPDCNFRKGPNLASLDSVSGQVTRLFHPRSEKWDGHFTRRGSLIEGLTPVGRATARLLDFNSPQRCRHRALLVQLGML